MSDCGDVGIEAPAGCSGGWAEVLSPTICSPSPERDHDRDPAAAPAARSPGERRMMKSEPLKLRSLAGARALAPDPGLVSAVISAPESSYINYLSTRLIPVLRRRVVLFNGATTSSPHFQRTLVSSNERAKMVRIDTPW